MLYPSKVAVLLAALSIGPSQVNSFVRVSSPISTTKWRQTHGLQNPFRTINQEKVSPSVLQATSGISIDTSSLTQYFLETVISYGVPTAFSLIVIIFAARAFKGAKDNNADSVGLFS